MHGFSQWFSSGVFPFPQKQGIATSWYIWKLRDKHVFTYMPIHPITIKHKTLKALQEWTISNIISVSHSLPPDVWLPTPDNRVKINFVGLFNGFTKTVGIGGIIRSSEGTLTVANVGKTTAEHSWEVELHALLQRVNPSRIRTAICNS